MFEFLPFTFGPSAAIAISMAEEGPDCVSQTDRLVQNNPMYMRTLWVMMCVWNTGKSLGCMHTTYPLPPSPLSPFQKRGRKKKKKEETGKE